MWDDILDIFKYILPSVITFFTAFWVMRTFLNQEHRDRIINLRMQNQSTITPIRLQAYERLALFLERISLTALVTRVHKTGMSSRLLQSELTKTIRAEFEHNLSQQIYVSSQVWDAVKSAKEETIKAVNIASTKVSSESNGMDLVSVIFELVTKVEKLPTDIALDMVKTEARQVF